MMALCLSSTPSATTFCPTPLKQKALSHLPQSQVGGTHHHLFSLQLHSNDPCSAGGKNILRLSQRQCYVFCEVIYEIVYFVMKGGLSH